MFRDGASQNRIDFEYTGSSSRMPQPLSLRTGQQLFHPRQVLLKAVAAGEDRTTSMLALGGGGARGLAHLGAIEILDAAGFDFERIIGVSIGSLIGAMYAFEPNLPVVQKRAVDYLLSDTFQRHQQVLFGAASGSPQSSGGIFAWYDRIKAYLRANHIFHRVIGAPSLLPGVLLQDVVSHLLPEANLEDAVIPLSIVAVDLRSGRKVVLDRGPLREAVQASAALPGIFPPVEFEGMLLCDIGVLDSLPTLVAHRYSSAPVIAIDVISTLKRLERCDTALDVLVRMDEVTEHLFREHVHVASDLLIEPQVGHVEWFDFSSAEELIEAGRTATRTVLDLPADFRPVQEHDVMSEDQAVGVNWLAGAGI